MALKVLQQGSDVFLLQAESAGDKLKPINYDLSFSDKGFYLTIKDGFSLPSKIYGDPYTFAQRTLNTAAQLHTKDRGMGVLLSGKKGTGKSITAKVIAKESGRPVISINTPYVGQGLTNFINSIHEPVVFLFDEFEKTYAEEEQRNYLLSLLDGMASSRHLFVLTSNDPDIGEFFDSRPGRIRYHKQYDTLDSTIIDSIIDDKVVDPTLNKAIKEASRMFFDLSPDSLICMIEECLMYNEVPDNFLEFFNVRNQEDTRFEALLTVRNWAMIKANKGDPEFVERGSELFYDIDSAIDSLKDHNITDLTEAEKLIGADKLKYIAFDQEEYVSWYADPFRDRHMIRIDYMTRKGGGYGDHSVHWVRDRCEISRNGNEMIVKHLDSDAVLKLTVTANRKYSAF